MRIEGSLKMDNAETQDTGDENFVDELDEGTELLHGQFTIEKFLNSGGFGMTYLARDSLKRQVVIKECFPSSFCRRTGSIVEPRSRAHQAELKSVVDLFVQEAHALAKLEHPNIVGVHQVFEDNSTAYMVLDFVEGKDLLEVLEDASSELTPPQIKGILKDVLGAVAYIHDQNILHRDISPDNILLDGDLRPVLIDFGAAREEATKQSRVLSALRVVKDGYSPQEFYVQGSEQTPSSDLYALGATFFHVIEGEIPPNSQARLAAIASGDSDPYDPLANRIKGFDKKFLTAIDTALQILPKDRLQSAHEWMEMIEGARQKSRVLTKPVPMSSAAAETVAAEKKSKMAPLMATAAGIALVAGIGLYASGAFTGDSTAEQTAALNKAAAEAAAKAAEEEAALKADIAAAKAAQEEAKRKAEIAEARAAEEEAKRQAEIAAARAEEAEAKRQAEIAAAKAAEEEARKQAQLAAARAAEEEEARRQAEIAAAKAAEERARLQAEIAAAKAAEEEAKRQAEIVAAAAAEEAAKRQAEIAAAKAAEEEARKQAELVAARAAEEEAKRQAEIVAAKAAEEEARKQAELTAAKAAEDDAKLQEEIAAARAAEEEARKLAEATAAKAAEEKAKLREEIAAARAAEEEARKQAEIAAAKAAEEEAKREAEIAAAKAAEEEARRQTELAAAKAAEEEERRRAELAEAAAKRRAALAAAAEEEPANAFMRAFAATTAAQATPAPRAAQAAEPADQQQAAAPATPRKDVESTWSVELPFTADGDSNIIGATGDVAPAWAVAGTEIVAINDRPITQMSDIASILRSTATPDNDGMQSVVLTLKPADGSDARDQEWEFPIVQNTVLKDGTTFVTRVIDGAWLTEVAAVPAQPNGFQIGDRVNSLLSTFEQITDRTSLKEIFEREIAKGSQKLDFTVSRSGAMQVVSVNYASGA